MIEFTIEAFYTCPVKMPIFAIFHIYFVKFYESLRATCRGLTGHFWPAAHRLGTPDLDTNALVL